MALIANIVIIYSGLLLMFVTCTLYPTGNVFSINMNHQQFLDSSDDWRIVESPIGSYSFMNKSIPSADTNSNCSITNSPDIKGVSFSSNEDIHQSTIWVPLILINADINKENLSNVDPYTWIDGGYQMAIDIISTYDNGVNYISKVKWDVTNHTWIQTLEEINLDRGSDKGNRIIDSRDNEDNKTQFVDIPLHLKDINFPDNYKIIYSAWGAFLNDKGQYCLLMDSTPFADIPPPELKIAISELPHSIRKGETINIPIELNSSSGQNTLVKLNASQLNISNKSALHFKLIPKEVSISPYGTGYAVLEVKSLDVDYPAYINLASNVSFTSFPVLKTGKVIDQINPITFQKKYQFTLAILPELTILDLINNVLSTWGTAFSQILAILVAIGGAIGGAFAAIKRLRKPSGEQQDSPEKTSQ